MSFRGRMILIAAGALLAVPAFAAVSPNHAAWGKGPATHLMTQEEKDGWKKISTDAQAQAFIDLFWARRDPTPSTRENENKAQFDALVEYADKTFPQGKIKGSMTDRGKVLVVVGTPSRVIGSGAPKQNIQTGALTNMGGSLDSSTQQNYETNSQAWVYERERLPAFARVKGGALEIAFVDQNGLNQWKLGSSPQTNVNDLLKLGINAKIVNPQLTAPPNYNQVAQVSVPAPQVTAPTAVVTTSTMATAFKAPAYQAAVTDFKAKKTNPYKGLNVTYGEFVTSAGEYYVPIQLFVSGSSALPADKPVTFFGLVEDSTGKTVAVYEEPVTLTVSKSDFFYDRTIVLPSGKYNGVFGLAVDGKPVTMTSTPMVLTSIDKAATGVSKLFLSNNVFALTTAQMATDPFAFGGIKVVPKGDRIFSKSDELWYFIEARNPGLENGTAKMTMKLDIEGTAKSGKKVKKSSPVADAPAQELKGVAGHWGVGSAIPLATFEPGEYTLKLTLIDTIGKQTYTFSEPFKIAETK